MKEIKKIGVFCSGGDSPGMNACIRAIVKTCQKKGIIPVGIYRGYEGLIDGDFQELRNEHIRNILGLGGTILKTARSKRFLNFEGRSKAYEQIQRHSIDALIAIGGDGTAKGAWVFSQEFPEIPIVGCPGTIDNDLSGTDYTIGFDTAINTTMQAIDKIRDTAHSHDRLFFIEVMGRDSGMIALYAGIATGAEAILIPETLTHIDELVQIIKHRWETQKTSCIVVVAEGDDAGGAFEVAKKVQEKFNAYDTRISVLGHIQRGGSPTCLDRINASRLGVKAVLALLEGKRNVMLGILKNEISYTPFENAVKEQKNQYLQLLETFQYLM